MTEIPDEFKGNETIILVTGNERSQRSIHRPSKAFLLAGVDFFERQNVQLRIDGISEHTCNLLYYFFCSKGFRDDMTAEQVIKEMLPPRGKLYRANNPSILTSELERIFEE